MVHVRPTNPTGGGCPNSLVTHVLCGSSLWLPAKVRRLFPSMQKKRPWFEGRTQVPGCKWWWPCRARPAQFIAATYCWARGRSGAWLQKSRGANNWGALLKVPLNDEHKSPQSCDLGGGAITPCCPALSRMFSCLAPPAMSITGGRF